MRRYCSRPQEVLAVQWTGENPEEVGALAPLRFQSVEADGEHGPLAWLMAGRDGVQDWVPVPVGHYVVRSVDDVRDFWPVDPAYFERKYAEVGDA